MDRSRENVIGRMDNIEMVVRVDRIFGENLKEEKIDRKVRDKLIGINVRLSEGECMKE